MSFLFPSNTITIEAALRDLANGSAKARTAAAQALGDIADPTEKRRAIEALVRALEDDLPQVRAEACGSLGELGDPSTIPSIVKRLDDGAPVVRQHAAIALGTIAHVDGFEPLALALKEGPADLRFQAATSLAEIDPARSFEPILAALEDKDAQVVGAAALALGALAAESDDRRAIEPLAGKLDHRDPATRFDVAYALADLKDARGREILVGALADAARSWDAVTALANIAAIDALAGALADKRTSPEAAVLAAGKIVALAPESPHEPTARKVLLDALTTRKVHVRGLAIEQLEAAGGAWAIAPLEKLAKTGKGREVSEAIITALMKIRERAA